MGQGHCRGQINLAKVGLFLATIVLLAISLVIIAYWHARHTAQNAQAMLLDLQTLHVNASLEEAQRFVNTHPGLKEVNCTDPKKTNCEFIIRLDNHSLARLHLAPPINLAAGFTCSRGRIVRMGASIGVRRVIPGTFQGLYAAEVTEQLYDPDILLYPVHKLAKNARGQFIPWLVNQRLDEHATEAQRTLAYSCLNLSCLYKLGGCKDAEALAPSAWTAADKAGWHDETPPTAPH
jgi:hypothetical protein